MALISKSEFKLLMRKYIKLGYSREEAYDKINSLVDNSI